MWSIMVVNENGFDADYLYKVVVPVVVLRVLCDLGFFVSQRAQRDAQRTQSRGI